MIPSKLKFAFLYSLAALILLINVVTIITTRDIWTDPLYDLSDQLKFAGKTLFWLFLGALLLLTTAKRSRFILLLSLTALLYLIVLFVMNTLPLAQFYLFNVSGWSSLRVLAAVMGPGIGQILLFAIASIFARSLQKSGLIT